MALRPSFLTALVSMVLLYHTAKGNRPASSKCSSDSLSFHEFKDKSLFGQLVDLSKYEGKIVLLLNVASFWGYTRTQYPQLNALAGKYNRSICPLKVLGVPCNQFGYQEPGDLQEIVNSLKYVRPGNGFVPNFPLLMKRKVNGEGEDELYTWLKSLCPNPTNFIAKSSSLLYSPVRTTDITWNFEKFLVDHNGKPHKRYTPPFEPKNLESEITMMIEACLRDRHERQLKKRLEKF